MPRQTGHVTEAHRGRYGYPTRRSDSRSGVAQESRGRPDEHRSIPYRARGRKKELPREGPRPRARAFRRVCGGVLPGVLEGNGRKKGMGQKTLRGSKARIAVGVRVDTSPQKGHTRGHEAHHALRMSGHFHPKRGPRNTSGPRREQEPAPRGIAPIVDEVRPVHGRGYRPARARGNSEGPRRPRGGVRCAPCATANWERRALKFRCCASGG
jgi:hypothetical protein